MNNAHRITELQAAVVAIDSALATTTDLDDRGCLVDLQCEYIDALADMGVDVSVYAWAEDDNDGLTIDDYDHATIRALKGMD